MQSAEQVNVARHARGRRLRLALIAVVAIASGVYAAAVVRLMTQETELIFRTANAPADHKPPFPYEQVDLPRADGARQFAWSMQPEVAGSNRDADRTWVLYLHGNASTVASRMNVKHYTRLHELGLNVLGAGVSWL